LLALFGLLGYAFRKLAVPAAPMLMAFVLGPMAENALRQSLVLSRNSPLIFVQRPISAVILAVAVLLTLAVAIGGVRRRLRVPANQPSPEDSPTTPAAS
jgi:putative tricarboxylic transport membrane protein